MSDVIQAGGPPFKFKPIDLTLGDNKFHPDIKTDSTQYLALIGREWRLGRFSMQWYGMFFDIAGKNYIGATYRPAGPESQWVQLYELVPAEETQ